MRSSKPKTVTYVSGLKCYPCSACTRLGIRPERIEKGKPNQNGRHERMHRSLKDGAINPARYSMRAQQKVFDQYRQEYNTIRTHESLKDRVPEDVYQRSNRSMPSKLAEIEYALR